LVTWEGEGDRTEVKRGESGEKKGNGELRTAENDLVSSKKSGRGGGRGSPVREGNSAFDPKREAH